MIGFYAAGAMGHGGPTPGSWVPVSSVDVASSNPGWGGYTVRSLLSADQMVPGTKVRLTINNSGVPIALAKCYVQTAAASGDPYDFSEAPVPVTFSGSPTITSAGGIFVSDEIELPQAGGLGLVVSAYFGGTTSILIAGERPGRSTAWKSGDDAATVDATGYTLEDYSSMLSLIEVFQP